jgi:small subunit ribosomal protein S17
MNTTSTTKQLGIVVKTAMKDTAVVVVTRYVKHPKYDKFVKHTKKYLVHDAGNTAQIGDRVVISESRPISKRKHFVLATITVHAPRDAE